MLKVEHLNKSFEDKQVLHDVSFTVPKGKIVGFIGHNGAGKTTSLKHVVGIYPPQPHTVTIDGMDFSEQPLECKKILAYLPDSPTLYDAMSAIEYLKFIAGIYQVEATVAISRIEQLAKKLSIFDNLNEPISSMSHGMQQKIAVIGALLHSPRLLVLDEPFVGLDPVASHFLKQTMRDMCDEGASVLFSSHVLEVVENLCDEIIVIKEGKIVAQGRTDELIGQAGNLESYFLELQDGDEGQGIDDELV